MLRYIEIVAKYTAAAAALYSKLGPIAAPDVLSLPAPGSRTAGVLPGASLSVVIEKRFDVRAVA